MKSEDLIKWAIVAAEEERKRTAKLKEEMIKEYGGVSILLVEIDGFAESILKLLTGAARLAQIDGIEAPSEDLVYNMEQEIDFVNSYL